MADCRCKTCQLDRIINLLSEQGVKMSELDKDIKAQAVQLSKIYDELTASNAAVEAHLTELESLVEANSAAAEELARAKEAFAGSQAATQKLDDLNPDAEPGV